MMNQREPERQADPPGSSRRRWRTRQSSSGVHVSVGGRASTLTPVVRSFTLANPSLHPPAAPLPGGFGNEPLEPATHGRVHPEHQRDAEQQRDAAHQEAGGLEHQPARKRVHYISPAGRSPSPWKPNLLWCKHFPDHEVSPEDGCCTH